MKRLSHYLLLNKLEIENANAVSSPITYGFPSISGFLGAVHALNRKLVESGFDLDLSGVLIACHNIHVQRYRPHNYSDYTFNQSRNPIKKDGATAAIIEEGKAHLTVSLVIEVATTRPGSRELADNQDEFLKHCREIIFHQRMAGGSVHAIGNIRLLNTASADAIKKQLLPAFVLMEAKNDLAEITRQLQQKDPSATALDALVEVAVLHHEPVDTAISPSGWQSRSVKSGRGWLVPMPIGFQAIAEPFEPGQLKHSRSGAYPSQYVESIYSLGKWVFPNRLPSEFTNCFWRYSQIDNLYLFSQTQQNLQGA